MGSWVSHFRAAPHTLTVLGMNRVELDANPITVTVGGNTVEVCCEACAQSLREAHASTLGQED